VFRRRRRSNQEARSYFNHGAPWAKFVTGDFFAIHSTEQKASASFSFSNSPSAPAFCTCKLLCTYTYVLHTGLSLKLLFGLEQNGVLFAASTKWHTFCRVSNSEFFSSVSTGVLFGDGIYHNLLHPQRKKGKRKIWTAFLENDNI